MGLASIFSKACAGLCNFAKSIDVRDQFPILNRKIYLNTPYTGLLSEDVKSAVNQELEKYYAFGDAYKKEYVPSLQRETEEALKDFLAAQNANVFLTQSFSSGFSNFLFALPKSYKFLLLEEDYPSITTLVADHGFDYDELKITEDVEVQLMQKLAKGDYQVLAFSVIQYTSGLFFDLEVLKKIKSAYPNILILLDGTQFLAAEPYSFSNCAADAIFASTYKWFLAGYGTGLACIRSSVFSHLKEDLNIWQDRYDRGHISLPSIAALHTALRQIENAGFAHLMQRKKDLNEYFYAALEKKGKLPTLAAKRKQHASFYTLALDEKAYQLLLDKNVSCIQRGSGIRVGVHHYNTKADIDSFMAVLSDLD